MLKYMAAAIAAEALLVSSFVVDKTTMSTVTIPGKIIGTTQVTLFTRMVRGAVYNNQDAVFFHGFGDCVYNHEALFTSLTSAGFGVITFDFPGHGQSPGSINDYTIPQLGQMGVQVWDLYNTTPSAIHLVGWSTGGLAVARVLQDPGKYAFSNVVSAVMHAPGVKVYPLVGSGGFLTNATLTNNPGANQCPFKPTSPLLSPLFAANLLTNAGLSWMSTIQTPSLVIVGGNTEDKYVITSGVKDWVINNQCSGVPSNCALLGVQCPGAKHELDNEPSPVGDYVRAATVAFIKGDTSGKWGTGCAIFNSA